MLETFITFENFKKFHNIGFDFHHSGLVLSNYKHISGCSQAQIDALKKGRLGKIIYHDFNPLYNAYMDYSFLRKILPFLAEFNIRHYSCTFAPACIKYEIVDGRYKANSKLLNKYKLLIKLREKKDFFDSINYRIDVGIENTNYFPYPEYQHICEPDFISKSVRDYNFNFTLDIAHAMISANNMGINIKHYLHGLPLDKCNEIHLTSPSEDLSKDIHNPPTQSVFQILSWVLNKIVNKNKQKKVCILIEHNYNNLNLFTAQYKYLNSIVNKYNKLWRE